MIHDSPEQTARAKLQDSRRKITIIAIQTSETII